MIFGVGLVHVRWKSSVQGYATCATDGVYRNTNHLKGATVQLGRGIEGARNVAMFLLCGTTMAVSGALDSCLSSCPTPIFSFCLPRHHASKTQQRKNQFVSFAKLGTLRAMECGNGKGRA